MTELREELGRVRKEKVRIQRKCQLGLAILLEKMKAMDQMMIEQNYSVNKRVKTLFGSSITQYNYSALFDGYYRSFNLESIK